MEPRRFTHAQLGGWARLALRFAHAMLVAEHEHAQGFLAHGSLLRRRVCVSLGKAVACLLEMVVRRAAVARVPC